MYQNRFNLITWFANIDMDMNFVDIISYFTTHTYSPSVNMPNKSSQLQVLANIFVVQ